MTYQDIVYLSNEIRFVLTTSRQVNLTAQNASLAARRAGNVRGFQVVSAELKSFSQGLAHSMREMAGDILAIAQNVSADYRHQRLYRHQQATLRISGDADVLVKVLAGADIRREDLHGLMGVHLLRLDVRLSWALRLCNNGRVLARSALIEATAGDVAEAMLRNVAQDIERTVEDTHGRLKRIGTRLRQEHANP